ncbi:hypothetical protein TeGR_g2204 [Tetraparma gracilis]|uniref:Thioesterase domain-containing protein n=1 Tax=Tetraparma gracilis TaxID=2962635 RepID=A0ABQ6NCG8_9STRA|nr:hypothetical protein TeGR_g2204 [Tetraparma gracilis]
MFARAAAARLTPAALGSAAVAGGLLLSSQQREEAFCLATPPKQLFRPVTVTPSFRASHAIHENLVKPSAVAHYSVFAAHDNTGNSAERPLVQVNLKFGNKVNGHKGIVHGGVASLLFDDAFGFAYFSATAGPDAKDFLLGFTANLTVNYRAPLRENSEAVLKVWLEGIEGRKVKLRGRLQSEGGEVVYSEASALFIIDRSMKKISIVGLVEEK